MHKAIVLASIELFFLDRMLQTWEEDSKSHVHAGYIEAQGPAH